MRSVSSFAYACAESGSAAAHSAAQRGCGSAAHPSVVEDSLERTSRNEQRQSMRRSRDTDPSPRPSLLGTAPTICAEERRSQRAHPRAGVHWKHPCWAGLRAGLACPPPVSAPACPLADPAPSAGSPATLTSSGRTSSTPGERERHRAVGVILQSREPTSAAKSPGSAGGAQRPAKSDRRSPARLDVQALHLRLVVLPEERRGLVPAGHVQQDE